MVPDLETPTNGKKAEILATFFSSVFTKENTEDMPIIKGSKMDEELKHYKIKLEKVMKKLSKLNPSKSPESDNIHPRILKDMSGVLDKSLAILYQNTLAKGKIPNDQKHAKVTTIFKKREQRKPNNYRPVCLTCISCKVMECIIRDQIMEHMKIHNLFSEKQFGFLDD